MLRRLLGALRPAPVARRPPPPRPVVDSATETARRLVDGGKAAAACAILEPHLAAVPDDVGALALLGWARFDLGDAEAARAALARALALDPAHVEALNAMGALDADAIDPNPAITWFRRALAVAPDNAGARYNLAQRLFFAGEYGEGFDCLRARHRTHFQRDNPLEPLPLWRGEPLAGQTVFAWCDWGGLGDHLQFVRYLPMLKKRAGPARLLLGCQPECLRLFHSLAGVDAVLPPGTVPAADVHVPLLDLPWHFGTTAQNVPAAVPYLHADPELVRAWSERLARSGPADGVPRAGLVWATGSRDLGGAYDRVRRAKSIPPEALQPLAHCGATLVSLQKGTAEGSGLTGLIDLTEHITDFADTAALIEALDIVVSTDTAVAHLAGALGKPVLLLLRREGGMFWSLAPDASPWYPQLRIVRQSSSGDWGGVISRAAAALARLR